MGRGLTLAVKSSPRHSPLHIIVKTLTTRLTQNESKSAQVCSRQAVCKGEAKLSIVCSATESDTQSKKVQKEDPVKITDFSRKAAEKVVKLNPFLRSPKHPDIGQEDSRGNTAL